MRRLDGKSMVLYNLCILLSVDASLTIDVLKTSDAGSYTCVASNNRETVSTSTAITVEPLGKLRYFSNLFVLPDLDIIYFVLEKL